MSNKDTLFYMQNKEVLVDFEAENISSDGGLLLLEKMEREHGLINYYSKFIAENRNSSYVKHSTSKLLKQRVILLMQGYEDANDADLLKNDPIVKESFQNGLGSQPTISRFENIIDKRQVFILLEV